MKRIEQSIEEHTGQKESINNEDTKHCLGWIRISWTNSSNIIAIPECNLYIEQEFCQSMTGVVHLGFLITHEIIREFVIPGIVVIFLNTLFFGDWGQFEQVSKNEENDTWENPFEEPDDFKEKENSDLTPMTLLPSFKFVFAEVDIVEEKCLTKS